MAQQQYNNNITLQFLNFIYRRVQLMYALKKLCMRN